MTYSQICSWHLRQCRTRHSISSYIVDLEKMYSDHGRLKFDVDALMGGVHKRQVTKAGQEC